MAIDYDKWEKKIDSKKFKEDIKEVEENGTQFKEVPHGTYEVRIVDLKLKESKAGNIMVAGQFGVLEGEYKGSSIFMNQLVDEDWKMERFNKFLRSLEIFDDSDIYFENWKQYDDLLKDLVEEAEKQKLEYLLEHLENSKGFVEYKIKEVYQA